VAPQLSRIMRKFVTCFAVRCWMCPWEWSNRQLYPLCSQFNNYCMKIVWDLKLSDLTEYRLAPRLEIVVNISPALFVMHCFNCSMSWSCSCMMHFCAILWEAILCKAYVCDTETILCATVWVVFHKLDCMIISWWSVCCMMTILKLWFLCWKWPQRFPG